jgi:hypothetical protein
MDLVDERVDHLGQFAHFVPRGFVKAAGQVAGSLGHLDEFALQFAGAKGCAMFGDVEVLQFVFDADAQTDNQIDELEHDESHGKGPAEADENGLALHEELIEARACGQLAVDGKGGHEQGV